MMARALALLVAPLLMAALAPPARGHPQCLDFLPPFAVPRGGFCPSELGLGCCAKKQQGAIELAAAAALVVGSKGAAACMAYHRNVSCARCHPYAAHIYDAAFSSDFDAAAANPGLQSAYCKEYYQACRDSLLVAAGATLGASHTEAAFCGGFKIVDQSYELPGVLLGGDDDAFGGCLAAAKQGDAGMLCGLQAGPVFRNPIAATHDGVTDSLYVVEQRGVIHRLDLADPSAAPSVWLDLSAEVSVSSRGGDERGLLALVFHPDYATDRRCFVYYYAAGSGWRGKTRLAEFRAGRDGKPAVSSLRVIMDIPQPEGNHNGGDLVFGRLGDLFVFTGDGGGAGDRHGAHGNGQDPGNLLGKALRINVSDTTAPYAIPGDNPFVDAVRALPAAVAPRRGMRCPAGTAASQPRRQPRRCRRQLFGGARKLAVPRAQSARTVFLLGQSMRSMPRP